MTDAICAAAIGCKAYARGEGVSKGVLVGGGGAGIEAHIGQSTLTETVDSPSLSSTSTSFMPPALEQTICKPPGLRMVEATADPKNSANHTSMKLAMSLVLRSSPIQILLHISNK